MQYFDGLTPTCVLSNGREIIMMHYKYAESPTFSYKDAFEMEFIENYFYGGRYFEETVIHTLPLCSEGHLISSFNILKKDIIISKFICSVEEKFNFAYSMKIIDNFNQEYWYKMREHTQVEWSIEILKAYQYTLSVGIDFDPETHEVLDVKLVE